MDIVIIAPGKSKNAEAFASFARSKGHIGRIVAPGEQFVAPFPGTGGIVAFADADIARTRLRYLGVPVIEPGGDPEPAILDAVETGNDASPLRSGEQESIAAAFVTSTEVALREMASAEIVVRATYARTLREALGEVSASLRLATDAGEVGGMVLNFPKDGARRLATRVLELEVSPASDDSVRDCVGEVLNVIAGQAKAMLGATRHHFRFGTPRFHAAGEAIGAGSGVGGFAIAFESEFGPFALQASVGL